MGHSVIGRFVMWCLVLWDLWWVGFFVMDRSMMGCFVMGCFVIGRFCDRMLCLWIEKTSRKLNANNLVLFCLKNKIKCLCISIWGGVFVFQFFAKLWFSTGINLALSHNLWLTACLPPSISICIFSCTYCKWWRTTVPVIKNAPLFSSLYRYVPKVLKVFLYRCYLLYVWFTGFKRKKTFESVNFKTCFM